LYTFYANTHSIESNLLNIFISFTNQIQILQPNLSIQLAVAQARTRKGLFNERICPLVFYGKLQQLSFCLFFLEVCTQKKSTSNLSGVNPHIVTSVSIFENQQTSNQQTSNQRPATSKPATSKPETSNQLPATSKPAASNQQTAASELQATNSRQQAADSSKQLTIRASQLATQQRDGKREMAGANL
jgi:hypothetical protein